MIENVKKKKSGATPPAPCHSSLSDDNDKPKKGTLKMGKIWPKYTSMISKNFRLRRAALTNNDHKFLKIRLRRAKIDNKNGRKPWKPRKNTENGGCPD